jgi:hypothetical protein
MPTYRLVDKIEDQPMKIFLELDDDGAVNLKAEDKDGNDWYLLKLTPNGTVLLNSGIGEELGFDLDSHAHLRVEKEE